MAEDLTVEEKRLIWKRRLLDAEEKRHLIKTGANVEQFVDQNGESIKYNKANIGDLESYIAELEGLLDPSLVAARVRHPIRYVF